MPTWRIIITFLISVSIALQACNTDEPESDFEKLLKTPSGFPAIQEPVENKITYERWILGKKLFYDPLLSRDSSISCASCHKSSLAFSDDVALSSGVENAIGTRNSISLTNIAYHPYFMREGGVPTLEAQVLVPIQEHTEMDFNIVAAGERLQEIPEYIEMSQNAYGMLPDYYVITRALACFERTLISGNSGFDKFEYQGKSDALTQSQLRGKDLFFSNKTDCSSCHSGFNFTNYSFENNGLYEDYLDKGRFILTSDLDDYEKFKTPSLRNVSHTAPYMHDGSISTLEAVIEHYNNGGEQNNNKSILIRPLDLEEEEKIDLVNFLESLSDYEFITNPLLK